MDFCAPEDEEKDDEPRRENAKIADKNVLQ